MLNRRQIRLKVMHSLYSYFCLPDLKSKRKDEHLFEVSQIKNLFYLFINTLLRVSNFSKEFHTINKKKFFPSELDLNPNYNFFNNKLLRVLRHSNIVEELKDVDSLSEKLNIAHDLDRKIFLEVYKNDFYQKYITSKKPSLNDDLNFTVFIIKNVFGNYDLLKQLFCEENVLWLDDYEFVLAFLINKIKNYNKMESFKILSPFKNTDDKLFFNLLYEKTIEKNKYFDQIINENSSNWELERIAKIDLILLKMGLTELFFIKKLPFRVTLNEYIEISKFYSTKNSGKFINGILDKVIRSNKDICKK